MRDLTIVMTTYIPPEQGGFKRATYAMEACAALEQYMIYDRSQYNARLLLADDGSEPYKLEDMVNHCHHLMRGRLPLQYITGKHNGIGASLNRALAAVQDLWIYTTDDWVLTQDYDISQALLLTQEGYDYIRLGPLHANVSATIRYEADVQFWLHLHQGGKGYCFATRPFLATKKFYDKVGTFNEGLDAYDTERIYNERVCNIPELKLAAHLPDFPWKHVGEYEVGHNPVIQSEATV